MKPICTPLIHINEALAGLPVETRFLCFDDVLEGKLDGVDVVINAGRAGTGLERRRCLAKPRPCGQTA